MAVWAVWAVVVIAAAASENELRRTGNHAVGVVERTHSGGNDYDDVYADVRFTDESGRTWLVEVDATDADKAVHPQSEMGIFYDPDDPSRAVIADPDPVDAWMAQWLGVPLKILLPGVFVAAVWWSWGRTRPNGQVRR